MYCYLLVKQDIKNNLDNILNVICPFCNYITENLNYCEENLQFEDYADIPMIWCNKCMARSFLDLTIEQMQNTWEKLESNVKPDLDFLEKYKINFRDIELKNNKLLNNLCKNNDEVSCYKIPLLKIKNITNYVLLGYNCDNKLSREQLCEFLDSKYTENYERLFDKKIMDKYGITKNDEDFDSRNSGNKIFNLSFSCDSYNTDEPLIPYPKKFEIPHDGVHVGCELENNKIVFYWGD